MDGGAQSEVPIDALPNELVAACLSELSAISALGRAGRASRQWRGVAQSLLAPHKAVHIGNVVANLDNRDWEARQIAVQRLCNFFRIDSMSLGMHAATIVAKLKHPDEDVRHAVVEVLENVDAASIARHGATIATSLEDTDAYVRKGVIRALGNLDQASFAFHAAAIVTKLEDPAPCVRRQAVLALGSTTYASAIAATLQDPVPYVRHAAARTLIRQSWMRRRRSRR